MAVWNLEADYLSNVAAVLRNTRPILRGGDEDEDSRVYCDEYCNAIA